MTKIRSIVALLALITMSLGTIALATGVDSTGAGAAVFRTDGVATPVSNLSDTTLSTLHAPACPYNYACEAVPCPTPNACGVVEAGPISNLGPDQFMFVNLYDMGPAVPAFVYYCADPGNLVHSTICLSNSGIKLTSLADGTSSYSIQVQEADQGATPITGVDPGNQGHAGLFYCDSTGDNCSVDVIVPTYTNNRIPSPLSTVVIPVTFRNLGAACTASTQIITQSEFGFDQLFSGTDQPICSSLGSKAVVPFNTSIDGLSALTQLNKGSIQMAFTDDPQSVSQAKQMATGGFLAIPLALSSNVLASRVEMNGPQGVVPQPSYKLTANMVAGLMTGAYSTLGPADLAPCDGNPAGTCPLMAFENFVAGYQTASFFYTYDRSDAAGTTDQMFSWICNTPAAHVSVQLNPTTSYGGTEVTSGEQLLKDAFYPGGKGAPSGCVTTDQFPPIVANGAFGTFSTVDQQQLRIGQFVAPPGSTNYPFAGFAPMNEAVAQYYGLNPADLQNAAGAYVHPSLASVNADLADGSWDANGVWTPSYTNTADTAAYPMATVMYAVVPKNKISATDKAQIQDSLNQMLGVLTDPAAHLPAGIYPLPADVAAAAKDAVANGVDNPNYSFPKIGGTTTAPSSTPSSYSSSYSFSTLPLTSLSATSTSAGGSGKPTVAPTPSSSPTYGPISLSASVSRLVLPITVGSGIVLALLGLAMIGTSMLGRRAGDALVPAEVPDEVGGGA